MAEQERMKSLTQEPGRGQGPANFLRRVSQIGMTLLFVNLVLYVSIYWQIQAWQILVGQVVTSLAAIVASGAIYYLARQGRTKPAAYWLLAITVVIYPLHIVFLKGNEWMTILTVFIAFSIAVVIIWPTNRFIWIGAAALYFALYLGLLSLDLPFRYDTNQVALLDFIAWPSVAIVVVFSLWGTIRFLDVKTIRGRLILAFALLVLIPAGLIIAVTSTLGLQGATRQVINQLESVATIKEQQINDWLKNLQTSLSVELERDNELQRLVTMLQMPDRDNEFFATLYSGQMRRFQGTLSLRGDFEELFVMDRQGQVILSTDAEQEGKIFGHESFFEQGMIGPAIQPPLYSVSLGRPSVILSQPIIDPTGEVVGVLAGRASIDRLNKIMANRTGLGQSGETYLVGTNHILLTASRFAGFDVGRTYVRTEGAEAAIDSRQNGDGAYPDYRGNQVLGVYRWLPRLQVVLLAEQDQGEALRNIVIVNQISLLTTLLTVVTAVIAALFVTGKISTPLTELAETATQVAAGDLNLKASADREDEIGIVANAFNSMTTQLRELVQGLEERVESRTRRLAIVATISERINRILSLEDLLSEVVNQVKDNLGYYHAQIYLLDEERQNLMLAEGVGAAGAEMKAKGHRIPFQAETSLVARAARMNQIITIDNVRQSADWLPNPLLPDTCSEMAIPITLEGEVVGVLDIQQDRIGGLDESDADLLRSLAGQVSTAIRNTRLFAEVQTALAEARGAQARYQEQAWSEVRGLHQSQGYAHYAPEGRSTVDEMTIAQVRTQIRGRNRPTLVTLDGEATESGGPGREALASPVLLGDTIIGNLQLYPTEPDRQWTEQEMNLIEAVLDQVGQVAESLRLLNVTRERASREQLIGQITQRIRSATDIDSLMKIGLSELTRVLDRPQRAFVRFGSEAELITAQTRQLVSPRPTDRSNGNNHPGENGHSHSDHPPNGAASAPSPSPEEEN